MVDADGWLTVVERKKLVIVRGGANVYPAEVERVIRLNPAVTAVAVFGVPDERLGERVAALVQLGADIDLDRLRSLCGLHLSRYKVPEVWASSTHSRSTRWGRSSAPVSPVCWRRPVELFDLSGRVALVRGRHGIRVNTVAPGFFRSEITDGMYTDERSLAWLRKNTPLPYSASAEDFVGAVLWLVSEAGRYVTGQTVVIDGGWTAR